MFSWSISQNYGFKVVFDEVFVIEQIVTEE